MADSAAGEYRYPVGLRYPFGYAQVSRNEGLRRWREVRASMDRHGVEVLVVQGDILHSRYLLYLSNYYCYAPLNTVLVFPIEGSPSLVLPASLGPQFIHTAIETSWIKDLRQDADQLHAVVEKISLPSRATSIGVVGFSEFEFPAVLYEGMKQKLPDAKFQGGTEVIREAMDHVSRSSDEELMMLKKASLLADLSFKAVQEACKPGLKESELWATALQAIVGNGGLYPPRLFVTSGRRPVFPRGPPSRNILRAGDTIIMEIDANVAGISPQMCYALSLGRPPKDTKEMFDFCSQLYEGAIDELESGETYGTVESSLERQTRSAGYQSMTPHMHRFCLSGRMPVNQEPRPGEYFTLHPAVCNREFSSGAKLGDTVRIGKHGKVERLMKTPVKLHTL